MTRKVRKIEPAKLKIPAKKRVAAYARVSSEKDASLHSLSAQISYYSEWIQKQRGWEYSGVYADSAMTGTKDHRPEFQRLLTDCRDGKIDLVLTKSISRFARNTLTMLNVVRELKGLNVDVYFEKENIHSISGDGELMLTILASFAQEESKSVSDNIKWRIRNRFADGEIVNLRFIFGYRINLGDIEIDSEQAEVVRMIFTDYVSGIGCTSIAKKLREMGVPRPRGGEWNSERVSEIIRNEKYIGNALLQKKYVKDHLTKALVWNKGVLPQYYAVDTHPAIIDEQTFQKAQEIMAKNRDCSAGKNHNGQYPFTSKIVCGKCGKKFKRKTTHDRISWNCSTSLKYGKERCHAKQIPETILVWVVTEVLGLAHFDDTVFKQQINEILVTDANQLVFVFYDGSKLQKEWKYKSRQEVWTEEARQKARERQLKIQEKREAPCAQQEQ